MSKYYVKNQYILKNIDFNLNDNQSIAIMGPSGVGKTTLLNILGLLDLPSSGECSIEGKSTKFLNEKERAHLRNQMYGYIFQTDRLIPHYTVLDNVILPLLYRGVSRKKAKKKGEDCLAYFELSELMNRYPRALSGGQRQRVALVRAVVHEPKIILADELTSSLDNDLKVQTMERLFSLKNHYLCSLIVVTHDLAVAKWCDKIVSLMVPT